MRILVADDHALVREGLSATLREFTQQVQLAEATDADEVLQHINQELPFDLVLLDLFMPGSNDLNLLQIICNRLPDTPVVVLSASEDRALMRSALNFGAMGYICKSSSRKIMLSALRLVLSGGVYVPPDLVRMEVSESPSADFGKTASAQWAAAGTLTPRQRDVLHLLGQGKSNKEIARELELSQNTVKIHVAALLRALGVNNRTKAAMLAKELDLVRED